MAQDLVVVGNIGPLPPSLACALQGPDLGLLGPDIARGLGCREEPAAAEPLDTDIVECLDCKEPAVGNALGADIAGCLGCKELLDEAVALWRLRCSFHALCQCPAAAVLGRKHGGQNLVDADRTVHRGRSRNIHREAGDGLSAEDIASAVVASAASAAVVPAPSACAPRPAAAVAAFVQRLHRRPF